MTQVLSRSFYLNNGGHLLHPITMSKLGTEAQPLVYIYLVILGASPALPTGRANNKKKPVALSRYQLKSKLNDRLKLINSNLSIGRAYNLFKNMIKYNLIVSDQT